MADRISVYVNLSVSEEVLVPSVRVMVTLTIPKPAGDVAVIWLAELTVNAGSAMSPNVTAVISVNPVPVIVTAVPPAVGPLAGVMLVIAGISVAGATGALVLSGWVTVTLTTPEPAGDGAVA